MNMGKTAIHKIFDMLFSFLHVFLFCGYITNILHLIRQIYEIMLDSC
jgi:hypothetical protein